MLIVGAIGLVGAVTATAEPIARATHELQSELVTEQAAFKFGLLIDIKSPTSSGFNPAG